MNWEAIGAVGEVVGAAAVVLTLVFLTIQLRHSARSMDESNRLQRVGALDRHSESIGRFRARIIENEDVAKIWYAAITNGELTNLESLRLQNLFIEFVNTQRTNFERARAVGDSGLAVQAVKSIAAEIEGSTVLGNEWEKVIPWNNLASPEFMEKVAEEIKCRKRDGVGDFSAYEKYRQDAVKE